MGWKVSKGHQKNLVHLMRSRTLPPGETVEIVQVKGMRITLVIKMKRRRRKRRRRRRKRRRVQTPELGMIKEVI